MICFEVLVNGDTVCTAGGNDLRVMSTRLTWGRRDENGDETEFLRVDSDGMNRSMEHVRWAGREDLSVGDEITLRIVESDEADVPTSSPALSNELQGAISQMIEKYRSENPEAD